MKPILIVSILLVASCDRPPTTCVDHQRNAFDQCMSKTGSRAGECIEYAGQVFDNCAHEIECEPERRGKGEMLTDEQLFEQAPELELELQ